MRTPSFSLAVTLLLAPLSALAFSPAGPVVRNFDATAEMILPPLEYIRPSSILDNTAEWARIDLIGPRAKNIKLTVRIVNIGDTEDLSSDRRFTVDRRRGALYVYRKPSLPSFSTLGASSARDVLFFDANGIFISGMHLQRCLGHSCPSVSPPVPATYVLELGDNFILREDVGTFWRLAIPRYALSESARLFTRSVVDRAAARRKADLNSRVQTTEQQSVFPSGNELLTTVAAKVESSLRIADLRNAAMINALPNDALKSVYGVLKQATLRDRSLTYVFVVRPMPKQDTFSLIADNFTLLSDDLLDVSGNGAVDLEERPAAVGSLYTFPAFTEALQHAVLDTSVPGQTSLYLPVTNDQGDAVAVLGVVQRTGN